MTTADRSRSLALGNWWRGQPIATAQGRGRSAEVPAPGFEPSGWAANPRGPHPHPGRGPAAGRARPAGGVARGLSVLGHPPVPRGGAAVRPGTSLRPAGALLLDRGGRSRAAAQQPGLPSTNPAGNLGPPSASRSAVPDPRPATRRLRAAYAASRWRAASTRPVRLAGSRNFPSAPRSVPRLTREAGGETPRATNRRASSGPVRMRGEKGTSGCALPAQPRSNSPAQEAGGSVPGKLVGGNETF